MIEKAYEYIKNLLKFNTRRSPFGVMYFAFGFVLMIAGISASIYGFTYGEPQVKQIGQNIIESNTANNVYYTINPVSINKTKDKTKLYDAIKKYNFNSIQCGVGSIKFTIFIDPSKNSSLKTISNIFKNQIWDKQLSYKIILVLNKGEKINNLFMPYIEMCGDIPTNEDMLKNYYLFNKMEKAAGFDYGLPLQVYDDRFVAR